MYGDAEMQKEVAELKEDLKKISRTLEVLQRSKQETNEILSEKLDNFVSYHKEFAAFVETILSLFRKTNEFGEKLNRNNGLVKWYLFLNMVLIFINVLFLIIITNLSV